MLEDTSALDGKIAAAQDEIDTVVEMNKALIREHAATGMSQEVFDQKAKAFDDRFKKADTKLNRLQAEKQDRLVRSRSIRRFFEDLREQGSQAQEQRAQDLHEEDQRGEAGTIDVWSEQAWRLLVTQVTVFADDQAEFLFRGENTITVKKD